MLKITNTLDILMSIFILFNQEFSLFLSLHGVVSFFIIHLPSPFLIFPSTISLFSFASFL